MNQKVPAGKRLLPLTTATMMMMRSAFLLFLHLSLLAIPGGAQRHDGSHPFAQGNLFVVFMPKSGRSSEHSPQLANLSSLWCQATSNGRDRLPIEKARFVRVLPKPERVHEPSRFNDAHDRAFLDFGLVPVSSIGKYRCEINTREGEFVTGNLFVYMRPVLMFNSSNRLDQAEEGNNFAWIGPTNKADTGDDAVLNCPALGYPLPQIQWFKDGQPINTSATIDPSDASASTNGNGHKYLLTAQSLYIRRVEDNDEGTYKCVAKNSFPLHVDEHPREFQLTLEQHLRVTTSLSWLLPLLIIIACLLLLVIIIWGCSAWKRYRYSRTYNINKKEKELGHGAESTNGQQQQRLPLERDDVED